jgi:predicted metal-dependent hydrolase
MVTSSPTSRSARSAADSSENIEVRDLRFDVRDENVPRHWHGGRKAVTRFFDNLSIFFPAGERFFVASVRAHEKEITDPKLRADAKAFCQQEGIHTREHIRYNELLRAQGLPIDEMEERVKRLLGRVSRRANKRRRLAITAALEHFTAMLAQLVLEDERGLENANAEMAALWRWHAAEESEHKAVAFDVYETVRGPYHERAAVMVGATLVFWAKVLEHQVRLMRADGNASDISEWADLVKFLFVNPGPLPRIVPTYLRWFARDFHPNDADASDVVERWKQAFRVAAAREAS